MTARALITGVNGFVGQYLAEYLINLGYEVWGTTRQGCPNLVSDKGIRLLKSGLDNQDELIDLLNEIRPDEIYHLAGQSNVKESWSNKVTTLEANVVSTLTLLEAVLKSEIANKVRVLTVGSSEEYGKVDGSLMPIKEDIQLNPISPYGISKASVSFYCKQYYEVYGLKIVHARPFNHIGPKQRLGFVVADFSQQIADIEFGRKDNILCVGNLESKRDFTDVRDIVRAYYLLLQQENIFGEIYNISSNKAVSIQEILDTLISLSTKEIIVKRDESRMRPSDIPIYIGDNNKLKLATGWSPEIPLIQTLTDVMNSLRRND
ncbi:GDP-mannose 4,6-dehydratase [Paenibacillus sp. P26]|nr:GDP-mannose 4,6-dehydratase [Paenibacillus sp. P26]UUZ90821.1 GDP-mannose 4,6-dehydratase [Paenibacillus sp. P25]